jgi:hypothetical protein
MRSLSRSLPLLLIAAGLFAIASQATADTPQRFWTTTRHAVQTIAPRSDYSMIIHCPKKAPVRISGGFVGKVEVVASNPMPRYEHNGYAAGGWRIVASNTMTRSQGRSPATSSAPLTDLPAQLLAPISSSIRRVALKQLLKLATDVRRDCSARHANLSLAGRLRRV